MIRFNYRGIMVEATAKLQRIDYCDANGIRRTRFERNVYVNASFWNFEIDNDLYEFSFIKSSLNYFMQAYWKRSSKQGRKIELSTFLEHPATGQELHFTARQKGNRQSLEISLYDCLCLHEQIYLSSQEVIMLDIVISKAISLLSPDTIYINFAN